MKAKINYNIFKNKEKVKIDLKNKVLILDLYLNGMEKITEYMKSSYKKID